MWRFDERRVSEGLTEAEPRAEPSSDVRDFWLLEFVDLVRRREPIPDRLLQYVAQGAEYVARHRKGTPWRARKIQSLAREDLVTQVALMECASLEVFKERLASLYHCDMKTVERALERCAADPLMDWICRPG